MSAATSLTVHQRQVLDALRPILGDDADTLYEANGRSLRRLAHFARDSALPCCEPLVMALQIAQQVLAEELAAKSVFDSPRAVADFLKLHFAGQSHESFAVLFLDARHALVAFEDIFRGTLTQTSVYPREVLKRALHHNAAAVVLAHNHPSGVAEPSQSDELLTTTLQEALKYVDVRVLDHIVVAGSATVSFAERGLL